MTDTIKDTAYTTRLVLNSLKYLQIYTCLSFQYIDNSNYFFAN